MAAACVFPEELIARPLGYVALTGLDVINNAMHKSVWGTFTVNRRQDKVLNIKLLPGDAEFPRKKQKQRTSYEFYIPKGILKTNWMNKHLNLLPSLVVIFYDLDWNDTLWKEKQTECASRVAVVRSSLQDRNTKLAVVLIQKNMPLPPGEDPQAVQRAEALCQACELPSKSLFVLPFSDHLHGYVTRLEGAFYDIALAYYVNEGRVVKQHKELLNKSQHQLLFVRHQFKIAFYNELKQDPQVALKHYKQAYQYTLEQKLTDVNNLEVKLVAGFINYKICRISFKLGAPLDAISQFRKHIDFFKSKKGVHELEFEHSAWMAKQFSLFGDLFNEAIKNGLQAIQTQHPGFYYQQAANHSMMRMKLCQELCQFSEHGSSSESSEHLGAMNQLDFYGQRPWRQGCQANEAPDALVEQAGIILLQGEELKVEHFWIIIPLLSSAVAQFREYKSVRMKLYLMVQMGQEYSNAKDYMKALTLLNRVTPSYRVERWWNLLSSVLQTALRCAYLTASFTDYVTICLELVGRYCDLNLDEKTRIQLNLQRVAESKIPEPEHNCDAESIGSANEAWTTFLQTKDVYTIEMESLASFVECRACFNADNFHLDEVASVVVYLRSLSPFPINFAELGVQFNNSAYNMECVKLAQATDNTSELWMEPKKVKCFSFKFILSPADVNKKLEVKQVYVRLGTNVLLRWVGAGLDANISPSFDSSNYGGERVPIKYGGDGNILWDSITIYPFVDVLPREARVLFSIDHDSPGLVDEYYKFTLNLDNVETSVITDTKLVIKLNTTEDDKDEGNRKDVAFLFSEVNDQNNNEGSGEIDLDINEMQPGTSITRTVYLKSSEMGQKVISFKVSYNMEVEVGERRTNVSCSCSKEEIVKLDMQMPFSVSVKTANLKFRQISKVNADEPFTVMTYVKCTSPWPIDIVTSNFILNKEYKTVDEQIFSQIKGLKLNEGGIAGECQSLEVPGKYLENLKPRGAHVSPTSHPIGQYNITWKRTSADLAVSTQVNLPPATMDFASFYIETEMPPIGCVQEAMLFKYTVYNRTSRVQQIDVAIESNETFMIAGNSHVKFRILPFGTHTLFYSFYPLFSGELALPLLQISLPQGYEQKNNALMDLLPTHIFVKPKPALPTLKGA